MSMLLLRHGRAIFWGIAANLEQMPLDGGGKVVAMGKEACYDASGFKGFQPWEASE
ncbi:MAG: hypothetical protein H7836_05295 [Magnetococcus sp. YQC-3]